MREPGCAERQGTGRWANSRVANSQLPFRRRELAIPRLRRTKSPRKFAAVHASLRDHVDLQRHSTDRQTLEAGRSAALAGWRSLASRVGVSEAAGAAW